jgi:hypothetical protein
MHPKYDWKTSRKDQGRPRCRYEGHTKCIYQKWCVRVKYRLFDSVLGRFQCYILNTVVTIRFP